MGVNTNMKQNELYWPQHKVYLYGQLAFLPNDIEGKILRAEKLRHYFDADNLTTELMEYQRGGYFSVEVTDAGEFRLTDISSERFYKELDAYIKKIKASLPTAQQKALWEVATKQYRQRRYVPVVRWRDIYGDSSRYNYNPPFWELIFMPALTRKVKLISVGHDKTLPYLQKGDKLIPMPKELQPFYERPYAEIEIIDSTIRSRISGPREKKYKVTLYLTNKSLLIILQRHYYPIYNYKNTNSNSFRVASALYDAKSPLTSDGLNLKPDTKTELKHLLSNAGFRGIVRELFIEIAYDDKHRRQTVSLKKTINVDKREHNRIREYVKSLSKNPE